MNFQIQNFQNLAEIASDLSASYSIPDTDGDIKIGGEPGIGNVVPDSHFITEQLVQWVLNLVRLM